MTGRRGSSHCACHGASVHGWLAALLLLVGCGNVGGSGNGANIADEAPGAAAENQAGGSDVASNLAVAQASWNPLQFDLVCTTRGRVVWERDPTAFKGTPNPQQWGDTYRLIVDLTAMRTCEPLICSNYGQRAIDGLTEDEIIFIDRPTLKETFNRRTGAYHGYSFGNERLEVDSGTCRMEPFSGFQKER
jgi:hypothetical protein